MGLRRLAVLLAFVFGFTICVAQDLKAQTAPENPGVKPSPALAHRPQQRAQSFVASEGRIHLDIVVNDTAGGFVRGLEPWNFHIFDDGKPAKVLSFRAFDGIVAVPEPPVEVILLIDEVNLPFQQVAFVRSELVQFLRQNGGKLAQPVSIMRLTDKGLHVQPKPTTDGNVLVSIVKQIKGEISYINPAMGGGGALQRFQISLRNMATIAQNEATRPGRKLLIWVGPGWPMLESVRFETRSDEKNQRRYFDGIVELTNKLREARLTVYSVSGSEPGAGEGGGHSLFYEGFLKGVPSAREASSGNLALKVLIIHTGGRILGPGNDLAEQIDACIAEANAFYRVSFNPPAAAHPDEFHELKVQIDKPGLTVRTNTGYYNEPPGN